MSTKSIFISLLTFLTLFFTIGCDRIEMLVIDKTDDARNIGNVVFSSTPGAWGPDAQRSINGVHLQGDTLTLNVSHHCETPKLTLVAAERFSESSPVYLFVSLAYNANSDTCREWITEDYHFDLTPIKEAYQKSYQTDTGTIVFVWTDRSTEEPPLDFDYKF